MKEIKFRVWDKINNRMIKPKKFATIKPVIDKKTTMLSVFLKVAR